MAAKESSQRKLPLLRRSGPAPWGLHAPKTPKAEVARPSGYANAVLLFALNAYWPCSTFESGVPPNPRDEKCFRRAACPQAAALCL